MFQYRIWWFSLPAICTCVAAMFFLCAGAADAKATLGDPSMRSLVRAVCNMLSDTGRLPDSIEDLMAYLRAKSPKGKAPKRFADKWGKTLGYRRNHDQTVTVWTHGRDGSPGGSGDDADHEDTYRFVNVSYLLWTKAKDDRPAIQSGVIGHPGDKTYREMKDTFFRLGKFWNQSQRFPKTLAQLPLEKSIEDNRDGWGRKFGYQPNQDGSITIWSYGRDAKPGGEGLDADYRLTQKYSGQNVKEFMAERVKNAQLEKGKSSRDRVRPTPTDSASRSRKLTYDAPVNDLVFLPQGDLVAVCQEGKFGERLWQLWDIKQLKLLRILDEFPKLTTYLAFSQSGKQVYSIGEHGDVGLWEVGSKRPLNTWKTCNPTRSICLSDGGQFLAVGGQSEVQVVDLLTGKVRRFRPKLGLVLRLAFSRNNRWLAASDEGGGIQVWDTTNWEKSGFLEGTMILPPILCPTPDSVWMVRRDNTGTAIDFTDVRTGKVVRSLKTPHRPVFLLGCSPDGKILATGQAAAVVVVQIAPTDKSAPSRGASDKSAPPTGVGIAEDPRNISEEKRIIFWNTDTGRPRGEYRGPLRYGKLFISWRDNLIACVNGNEVVFFGPVK